MDSLGLLFPRYISDGAIFLCPTANAATAVVQTTWPADYVSTTFTKDSTDYAYDPTHTSAHDPAVVIVADQPTEVDKGLASNNHGAGAGTIYNCIGGQTAWKSEEPFCGFLGDNIMADGTAGRDGAISELDGSTTGDYRLQSWVQGH